MLIVIVVVLAVCSALMFYLWRVCREDGLALNAIAGIKTSSTMASEETWLYIHRKYRAVFCAAGIILVIMCMAIVAYVVVTGDISGRHGNLWWIMLLVGCMALLATVIPVGIVADRDAARYNREHGYARCNDR